MNYPGKCPVLFLRVKPTKPGYNDHVPSVPTLSAPRMLSISIHSTSLTEMSSLGKSSPFTHTANFFFFSPSCSGWGGVNNVVITLCMTSALLGEGWLVNWRLRGLGTGAESYITKIQADVICTRHQILPSHFCTKASTVARYNFKGKSAFFLLRKFVCNALELRGNIW